MNNAITKATMYVNAMNAGGINAAYSMLTASEKRYARYLVEKYGYAVAAAIQRSYIFGFDQWPFDYRTGTLVKETVARESFEKRSGKRDV